MLRYRGPVHYPLLAIGKGYVKNKRFDIQYQTFFILLDFGTQTGIKQGRTHGDEFLH